VTEAGCVHWTMALELCMESLAQCRVARLHLHVFFESSCCFKKSAKKLWSFKGQRGFLSHPAGTGRRWTNPGQGHYYLAMPKVSRVRCASTRAPFSGRSAYAASPEWVTSALQADKISLAAAKQEYVRCARNLQRNLQNLERISLERQRLLLERKVADVRLHVAKTARPGKSYKVVDEWLEHGRAFRLRYKFLVIEGPSCMGKHSSC
jgi:hypothetical protein